MAYDLIPLFNSGIFHVAYLRMLYREFDKGNLQSESDTFSHTDIDIEYTDNKNTLVIDNCFRL